MSISAENFLVGVPAECFATLREKFKIEWPKHIAAYTLFNTFHHRLKKNPESIIDVKVFCLNGDWESDGTFIAKFDTNVSFGTLDPKFEKLKTALKLLNYDNLLMFMCIPAFYFPMFSEVIEELELVVKFDIPGTMVHINKFDARALKVEIPENFKIEALSEANASYIKAAWTHGTEFSGKSVSYLITHNTNVGLFDGSGKLVAWCLTFDFGSLAALQVAEGEMRKGFGEIVTRAITKKIAEECDVDVTSNYVDGNIRSENLVTKIGFKKIDTNRWIGVCRNSK